MDDRHKRLEAKMLCPSVRRRGSGNGNSLGRALDKDSRPWGTPAIPPVPAKTPLADDFRCAGSRIPVCGWARLYRRHGPPKVLYDPTGTVAGMWCSRSSPADKRTMQPSGSYNARFRPSAGWGIRRAADRPLRMQPAETAQARSICRCPAVRADHHAHCQEGGHLRDGYETRHGSRSRPLLRATSGRCGRDSQRLASYHATQAGDDNREMLPQTECGRSGSEDGEHTWVRGC